MDFDFSKLRPSPTGPGEIDPIKLFASLQPRDPDVNDLWLGQGDSLREWHAHRNLPDIAINLTTGAGKTLVGLLAAQSLVNETQAGVVYVCASLQLVHQTATKALSYGLPVTTYTAESRFSNTLFQEGRAPCITTYQAVFNGLTRRWKDAVAIIFDDAHSATHIIRDQFTLTLDRDRHADIYDVLAAAFQEHLRETDSDVSFKHAMQSGDVAARWFLPPFIIRRNAGTIGRSLLSCPLSKDSSAMYAWGYLQDRLDLCSAFITPKALYFTPPVVPVRSLPYFRQGVRRVYLSATLAADDMFIRTFGKLPDRTISPETPAGQCERMVLIPSLAANAENDVNLAQDLIRERKALILSPTKREAESWGAYAVVATTGSAVADEVETFKQEKGPQKLCLVARYDGVDLPGDTCRLMVMHGLPAGLGPLERFMWDRLEVRNVLRSTVASRVVQSFGRISRGLSDHGVVVLVGAQLVEWLLSPANRRILPAFLRRQLDLGIELSRKAEANQLQGMVQQCENRNAGWLEFYRSSMAGLSENDERDDERSSATKVAEVEMQFGQKLWDRDYKGAAQLLLTNRQLFRDVGSGLGAWYTFWEGYLHELLGEPEESADIYRQARHMSRAMPNLLKDEGVRGDAQPSGPDDAQVQEVARHVLGNRKLLQTFDLETKALDEGTSAQAEEAARCLGSYLGLHSSRPDNEQGTGPDVLWHLPQQNAWSLELKTGKGVKGTYPKRHVAQAMDHVQWVRNNQDVGEIVPIIIGPQVSAHQLANPSDDLLVMRQEALRELRDRVRAALVNLVSHHLPVTLRADVARVFTASGLLWSELSKAPPAAIPLKQVK